MEHIRTQLSNVILEVLKKVNIRSFYSLYRALNEKELPCAIVEIPKFDSEIASVNSLVRKEFYFVVEFIVQMSDGIDSKVDEILVKIEKELLTHSKLSGRCSHLSTKFSIREEGNQPILSAKCDYVFTIFTKHNEPDTEI